MYQTSTNGLRTIVARLRNPHALSKVSTRLRSTGIFLSAVFLGVAFFAGLQSLAQTRPDFGPNVHIIDPSMSSETINSTLASFANEPQFGTNRYAVLFMPGTYNIEAPIGYYESIAGLGETPNAVTIDGFITPNFGNDDPGANLTLTFWRSMENMKFNASTDTAQGSAPNTLQWGVSQGTALRRIQINGSLELTDTNCGFASGGFIADSQITGNVNSCSQQQWFTRNSTMGSWTGSSWNMVFAGVEGAPFPNYPTNSFTVLPTTPRSREKPFLYVDAQGAYKVFVPTTKANSSGTSWEHAPEEGYSLPIDDFMIVQPSTSLVDINNALAVGKSLIFTPGIYQYSGTITINRPNTIVLGIGYPTIVPQTGTPAIEVADVDGVRLAGLLIDAGPVNSPVLLQIGNPGRQKVSHALNPTSLNDVFFRIAGATPGTATTTLEVDSNDVILDNIWAWRADHGNGVGWTQNIGDHGLVVNGNNVLASGLSVEHYEKNQVAWNGENGTTIFYQSELPYDVPGQSAWMNGTANGFSSYSVSQSVKQHAAYGLGVYSFFDQGINIVEDSAITVPNTPGVFITHAVSVFLTGSGSITHVVNDVGGSVQNGTQTSFLQSYPDIACEGFCSPPLNAPMRLSADEVSANRVKLGWRPSFAQGVRYNVFRSLDPDFTPSPEAQLISGLSDTSYTDTGINPSTTYFYAVQAVSDSSASQLSNIVKATTPNSGGLISKDIVDINAGGGAIGEWAADEGFTGGTATSTGAIVNTSLLPNAAPQSVYQTNRFGAMTYKIPGLTAGQQYVVNLHFAETFWNTPGQRQFNVLINGQEVLKNFDIVATAGGQNVATIQSFIESADSSGSITIQFVVGAADNPQINGIEIGMPCQANCPVAPDAPAKLTAKVVSQNQVNLAWATNSTPAVTYTVFRSQEPEFRPTGANQIVSGLTGTSYSDTTANPATVYYYVVESFNSGKTSQTSNYVTATTPTAGGRITSDILNINAGGSAAGNWIADKYFTGGTATSTTAVVKTPHVAEPAPLSVYQTNRFGNFTYTIPGFIPGGSYIVDLHFAETFWTAPGLRQFNVLINGKQMLTNYDIFASAGGEYLATVQSFAVTSDNTGTITIQFVPGSGDNPQVNGIEIGTGAVGHADPDR
jgi:Malectin domain